MLATVAILDELRAAASVRLFGLTNWSAETFPHARPRYPFLAVVRRHHRVGRGGARQAGSRDLPAARRPPRARPPTHRVHRRQSRQRRGSGGARTPGDPLPGRRGAARRSPGARSADQGGAARSDTFGRPIRYRRHSRAATPRDRRSPGPNRRSVARAPVALFLRRLRLVAGAGRVRARARRHVLGRRGRGTVASDLDGGRECLGTIGRAGCRARPASISLTRTVWAFAVPVRTWSALSWIGLAGRG